MVIQKVQHINNAAIPQTNMGDIGLPRLVRLVCFTPDQVTLGFLLRLIVDQTLPA